MGGDTLDWDALRQNGATLFIIQGFIASGKSTLARSVSAGTGALHFDADAYCLANFSAEELADWDRCFADAVAHLWRETGDVLLSGQSVVLDFGFWTKQSRDYAREQARRLDVPFIHIYVTASDDVLLERMKLRSGALAARNLGQFASLKASFEPPTPDETALVVST
ncbi:MAG: ATP-binding protein [Pseudomonadota bacterium]